MKIKIGEIEEDVDNFRVRPFRLEVRELRLLNTQVTTLLQNEIVNVYFNDICRHARLVDINVRPLNPLVSVVYLDIEFLQTYK